MISLKNLTIGYQQKNNRKVVAEDINATLHSGELTCLIGPNGVGKSTLLRTLSAFQPPLSGDIIYRVSSSSGGEATPLSLSQLTDRQLSRLIGVVLTTKPDVQNMTVYELVALGRSPYTGFWGRLSAQDHAVVEESIEMVGITNLSERMVQTLSDGERQKMMIAKALAQQTPIIYLDEPTAFLDYPSKADMMQLLHRLAHQTGKTIFLSTHDLELALQMADRLWLMQPTLPLSVGTTRELALDGSLSTFLDRPGLHFDPETLAIHVVSS
ncbi:MAG: ABC transporter ATP-binding protein [Prevotella sp.]|nr:ABC transporter ATP-binding protein [Prevotella sp.]